jgi:hypothetical protein
MGHETDWSSVIDDHAPPAEIIQTIADAMDADTYTREGKAVPDHRTRLAAAQTLLMHRRGRPAEAPEPKPVGDRKAGMADLLALLDDPEVVARIEAIKAKRGGKD